MVVHVQYIVDGDGRPARKVRQLTVRQLAHYGASILKHHADEGQGLATGAGGEEEPHGIVKANEAKTPGLVAAAAEGAGDFVAHQAPQSLCADAFREGEGPSQFSCSTTTVTLGSRLAATWTGT